MLDDTPVPVQEVNRAAGAATAGSAKERRGVFRRIRRLLLYGLALVLGPILLYFLFAVLLGLIPYNSDYKMAEKGTEVYVWTNGVHTGFLLPLRTPAKAWSEFLQLSGNPEQDEPARFLSFSWGDRGIFVNTASWSDLTCGNALNAVFVPSDSVIHVTFQASVAEVSDTNKLLVLDDAQFTKLVSYLERSLARNDAGHVKRLAVGGYKQNDDFYEATGKYHLFNTCNNWANAGLKEIGVRTALWAPFDTAIFYHLAKD